MSLFSEFLKVGYLPKELPPPFTSSRFGEVVAANKTALPPAFTDKKFKATVGTHNLARAGSLRRRLGLLNPIAFTQIAATVDANWKELYSFCRASRFSLSGPTPDARGQRAVRSRRKFEEFPLLRPQSRSGCRFLLRTDIAGCYSSIYTHSVPWALHTKAVAKKDHSAALFGNDLDRVLRNSQDQQTVGIAIGPDTSLVVAEVVLSAIDAMILKRHPKIRALRYLDDYEIAAETGSEAEEYLGSLQEFAGAFELRLNPRKTQIVELPQPLQPAWVRQLREFCFRTSAAKQRTDVMDFFDLALDLSRANPDTHVMSFAMGRLLNEELDSKSWDLLQGLIVQSLVHEPGCFWAAYQLYDERQADGEPIDDKLLSDGINATIRRHAPLGHSSEVSWALWLAIQFKIKLSASATEALCGMTDPVVGVLTLDANHRSLLESFAMPSSWKDCCCEDGLFGANWLLAYEANVKGWAKVKKDYVAKVPSFQFLKSNGVSFYGILAGLKTPGTKKAPKPAKKKLKVDALAASVGADDDWVSLPGYFY